MLRVESGALYVPDKYSAVDLRPFLPDRLKVWIIISDNNV